MPDTLPAMVRKKYPGVYDDLSDVELDAKVRAKYPGTYDDLPGPSAKPIDHSEPKMSAAYPGTAASPESVAERQGYRVPDAAGGHWQSTAGSELHREDNSVLGMPPEFAAISALAVARAAAAPATNVLMRAKAAMGAVAETATPIIKYEVTKAGLQGVGVPAPLAAVIAMGVSGYKFTKGAPEAPSPTGVPAAEDAAGAVSTAQGAAEAVESPLALTRRLKAENMAKHAASAPAPVEAPVTAPPADFQPSPLQKMFGMKPGVDPSPTQLSSSVRLAEIRAKVTLTAAEKASVTDLVKQGTAPEAALTQVKGVDPALAFSQKFGLPSVEEATQAVAERNRTGRWPGSPNSKQLAAKADRP